MPKDIQFAVVGLGMGGHHCNALERANGARLAAVCDYDAERLECISKQHGCKGYSRYSELLKDTSIDVISIAVESGKHAAMGVEALRAGKHIVVEKPVDITPARIKLLEDAVAETGLKCGCIFQSRVDACNVLLKKAIDKGQMGQLIGVHGHLPWFRAQAYYEGPHGAWHGTWKLDGGGSLMNQGIHTLDLVAWLAGPVRRVAAFFGIHNHHIEAEDQTAAALEFENGALGTFASTTCAVPESEQRIYMYGTKGSFVRRGSVLESYAMGVEKERERMLGLFSSASHDAAVAKDPMAVSFAGHVVIFEDMVKAVRNDREPLIPISSAKHSVVVANAIYKSARTGKAVEISSLYK